MVALCRKECRERWQGGKFLEKNQSATYGIQSSLEWVPYESYMEAQISLVGEAGILIVRFPAEASEDNDYHCHPRSDRQVTVIEGDGTFEYFIRTKLYKIDLVPGDQVWMPRGVLHTFRAGKKGLLVESIHSPFVEFEDPNCLVYPKKSRN